MINLKKVIIILLSFFLFLKNTIKDIDRREQELKKSGNYLEKLTNEEKELYKKQFKEGTNNIRRTFFTKKIGDWFLKISTPLYMMICIIAFLAFAIVINIFWGILILSLLILCGLSFFWLIKKLFKY